MNNKLCKQYKWNIGCKYDKIDKIDQKMKTISYQVDNVNKTDNERETISCQVNKITFDKVLKKSESQQKCISDF